MKVLGLITEYNPFHNGHAYHLEQSRLLTGADRVVCVMSGNFVQRGEPAIINKWARAEIALASGVDLVIELPVVFAAASAEYFAFGAVKLLDSLGIIDCISFGSESGDTELLGKIAALIATEPEQYKVYLKNHLSTGISYPAARQKALAEYFNLSGLGNPPKPLSEIMGQSNNILGIEYLKALIKLNSKIQPLSVNRISNNYNSPQLTGAISSATAVRNLILDKSKQGLDKPINKPELMHTLDKIMPGHSSHILMRELDSGRGPVSLASFDIILLSVLRSMTLKQVSYLPYIAEGLENRMKTAAEDSGSLAELIANVRTKRYTRTRIQRALLGMITGMTSMDLDNFMRHEGPQYIRVLGFNQKGRDLLSLINKTSSLPIIVKPADFKYSSNSLIARMLEIEAAATNQYVLAYKNPLFRKGGQEFTSNLIRWL